jgi:hypothetical protein
LDQGSSDVLYNKVVPGNISDDNAPLNDFNVFQMNSMEIYSPECDMSFDPREYI